MLMWCVAIVLSYFPTRLYRKVKEGKNLQVRGMDWDAVSSDDANIVKTVQYAYTEIMWLTKYRISV
jgi:hypothetical protein